MSIDNLSSKSKVKYHDEVEIYGMRSRASHWLINIYRMWHQTD